MSLRRSHSVLSHLWGWTTMAPNNEVIDTFAPTTGLPVWRYAYPSVKLFLLTPTASAKRIQQ